MLSEEEKKAIEDIKLLSIGDFITWFTTDGIIKMGLSAKTVLNLIDKLQKENEILKRAFDKQTADMSNNLLELQQKDKYIKDSEDITKEMNNDINKLLLEIKKKDKQINLMAEVIFKKFKAPLIIEYGIENKEQFIKIFEQKAKEKGKEYEENCSNNKVKKI